MNDNNYAMEVIKYQKDKDHKIIKTLIIALVLSVFFGVITNILWIYFSYLPTETTSSYDIQSKDNGNAVYNDSGKVDINGKSKGDKDN